MAIHDSMRVEAGMFHHFHHGRIEEIQRALGIPRRAAPLAARSR